MKTRIIILLLLISFSSTLSAVIYQCSPAAGGKITHSGKNTTATPNSGYTFSKWSIKINSQSPKYSTKNPDDFSSYELLESMGYASVTITANFTAVTTYTITWKNWDGSTLSTSKVNKGATPSYSGATPTRPSTAQYAYTFSGWTPAITAATANKTYTATYTQTLRKYSITVNSSNVSQGTAAGGGTYDYGTNHQITATPNECYRFTQWSDGNMDNPRTITVTGDATYTAEFEQIQYTIEAQSADAGQGSATVTNP